MHRSPEWVVKLPLMGCDAGHVQALTGDTPGRPPELVLSAWATDGGVTASVGSAHSPRFCSQAPRCSLTNSSWWRTFGGTVMTWA
jgi:hypothetical protein